MARLWLVPSAVITFTCGIEEERKKEYLAFVVVTRVVAAFHKATAKMIEKTHH